MLGVTITFYSFVLHVSSGSHENAESQESSIGSLPLLESSSSSESLNTFRNVIMPDNENNLYTRIIFLEEQSCYNLPPQSNLGDYERLVREHFDQAINVDHFREIYDFEFLKKRKFGKESSKIGSII